MDKTEMAATPWKTMGELEKGGRYGDELDVGRAWKVDKQEALQVEKARLRRMLYTVCLLRCKMLRKS